MYRRLVFKISFTNVCLDHCELVPLQIQLFVFFQHPNVHPGGVAVLLVCLAFWGFMGEAASMGHPDKTNLIEPMPNKPFQCLFMSDNSEET